MFYEVVLWTHASAMLAALVLFVVSEILLILAQKYRSSLARSALRANSIGGMLTGIGVLGGITLVYVGGWPLLTPWLLASLALIAVLMTVGRLFVSPWQAKIQSALSADISGAPLKTFISDKTALIGRAAMIALFVLIVALMTEKPDLGPWL